MPKLNTRYADTVPSNENITKTDVDLSELLTVALKKINKEIKGLNSNVRCGSLPTIKGNKVELSRLFDLLIEAIFKSASRGSKLFLYVDCILERDATLKRKTNYLIKFLTNVAIGKSWKEQNKNLLLESNQIILAHNGVFSINTIDNSGCLFTIVFPGKGN